MEVEESGSDPAPCCLCGIQEDDQLRFGQLFKLGDLSVHHFCMLFSPKLAQKGKDDEGAEGFLAADVKIEMARSKSTICCFCGKGGATGLCMSMKCKRHYHVGCCVQANGLLQFFGQFKSFCVDHRPRQSVVGREAAESCGICLERTDPEDDHHVLWTPCCRHFFHRPCLQRMAYHFGYFFYCPGCRNKDNVSGFLKHMRHFGIFIPKRDASWEMVPNAFGELLERHLMCDVRYCLCNQGRSHQETDVESPWRLFVCGTCGSAGSHAACSSLPDDATGWVCRSCTLEPAPVEKATLKDFLENRAASAALQGGEGSSRAPQVAGNLSLDEVLEQLDEPEKLIKFTVNPLSGLSVQTRPVNSDRMAAREPGRRPVSFSPEQLLPEVVVSEEDAAEADLRLWSQNHVTESDEADSEGRTSYDVSQHKAPTYFENIRQPYSKTSQGIPKGRRKKRTQRPKDGRSTPKATQKRAEASGEGPGSSDHSSVSSRSSARTQRARLISMDRTLISAISASETPKGSHAKDLEGYSEVKNKGTSVRSSCSPASSAEKPAVQSTQDNPSKTGEQVHVLRIIKAPSDTEPPRAARSRPGPKSRTKRVGSSSSKSEVVLVEDETRNQQRASSPGTSSGHEIAVEVRPIQAAEMRDRVPSNTEHQDWEHVKLTKRTLPQDKSKAETCQPTNHPGPFSKSLSKDIAATPAKKARTSEKSCFSGDVGVKSNASSASSPAVASIGSSNADPSRPSVSRDSTMGVKTAVGTGPKLEMSRDEQLKLLHQARVALYGYQCPICGKKHQALTQVTLHYYTSHSNGDALFRCKICNAKFSYWQPGHIRSEHPEVKSEHVHENMENKFEEGKRYVAKLILEKKKLYVPQLLDQVLNNTCSLNRVRLPNQPPKIMPQNQRVLNDLASARAKEESQKKEEMQKREHLATLKALRIGKLPTVLAADPAEPQPRGYNTVECPKCTFRGTNAAVVRHAMWHTSEAKTRGLSLPHHCTECFYASESQAHVEIHLMCVHMFNSNNSKSSTCSEDMPSSGDKEETSGVKLTSKLKAVRAGKQLPGQRQCQNIKRFDCPYCDSFFMDKVSFKAHMTRLHIDGKPAVPCPYPFCFAENVSEHGKWYHKTALIKNKVCDDCGGTIYDGIADQHKDKVCLTMRAILECPMPICGYGSKDKGDIDRHLVECHSLWIRGVSGSRAAPYECSHCDEHFTFQEFQIHLKCHLKENPKAEKLEPIDVEALQQPGNSPIVIEDSSDDEAVYLKTSEKAVMKDKTPGSVPDSSKAPAVNYTRPVSVQPRLQRQSVTKPLLQQQFPSKEDAEDFMMDEDADDPPSPISDQTNAGEETQATLSPKPETVDEAVQPWAQISLGEYHNSVSHQSVNKVGMSEPNLRELAEDKGRLEATLDGSERRCYFCSFTADSVTGLECHRKTKHLQELQSFELFVKGCMLKNKMKKCPFCGECIRMTWIFFRHVMSHKINVQMAV